MRKKSHISLARYLVRNLDDGDLRKHKLSFYIGSILPDCKPSFLYKKHEITGTFPQVKREIERLSSDYQKKYKRQKSKHNRNLLGGLYRENPVKSRNYEAVKSSKKWENVGNSYIIPALLLYRYSYI